MNIDFNVKINQNANGGQEENNYVTDENNKWLPNPHPYDIAHLEEPYRDLVTKVSFGVLCGLTFSFVFPLLYEKLD